MITRDELNDIFRQVASEEFADITNDTSEHVFSERFERRMKRLIKSVEKHGTTPIRVFCKRLIIIATAFIIFITVTTQVQAIRKPIVSFITKVYDIYTEIAFGGDVSTSITCEYKLGYIPASFILESSSATANRIIYQYTNTSGESIKFTQGITKNTSSFIDTETTTSKPLNVAGIEATLYQSGEITFVQWTQNSYFMRLTCRGNFNEAELIKMVESVTPIE